MPELKGLRCPACGAPLNEEQGDGPWQFHGCGTKGLSPTFRCSYCGSGIRIEEKKDHEPEILVVTPKRNVLDFILITLGALWILLVVAVVIGGRICTRPSEWIASLLICSPGIVLLLIGFRRKKTTVFRDGKKQ